MMNKVELMAFKSLGLEIDSAPQVVKEAKACDCGSVHFNLLKSGIIECAGCQQQFGQWCELDAGVYSCEECGFMTNKDIRQPCDCGSTDWIPCTHNDHAQATVTA